jgi:hypothetical protein
MTQFIEHSLFMIASQLLDQKNELPNKLGTPFFFRPIDMV